MNLLITRHDKIGDFVLTLPMIKIAKEQTGAKIAVLVSQINYEFAKNIDFIDDVLLFDKNIFVLAKRIKERKIDISISAYIDTTIALALLFANVKIRISPATKIAQIFMNKPILQRRSKVEKREFEYNIDLLKAVFADINPNFTKPVLTFNKNEIDKIFNDFKQKFNIQQNYKFIAIHPGFGGSSDGNLSLEDYVNLAKFISTNQRIKIVFTFGPDDENSLNFIKNHIDFDAIIYQSDLTLINFCKLIVNFSLFISTSTGPMHLAGAVNTPTFSFFGNSKFASDKRWGSINEKQTNFCISQNYTKADFMRIKEKLKDIVNAI